MRRNKLLGVVVLSFALLAIVWGVSAFISMMLASLISLFIGTDSDWVFIWVGFPLSLILAACWAVRRWDYVKAFITGRGGW